MESLKESHLYAVGNHAREVYNRYDNSTQFQILMRVASDSPNPVQGSQVRFFIRDAATLADRIDLYESHPATPVNALVVFTGMGAALAMRPDYFWPIVGVSVVASAYVIRELAERAVYGSRVLESSIDVKRRFSRFERAVGTLPDPRELSDKEARAYLDDVYGVFRTVRMAPTWKKSSIPQSS